MNQFSVCRDVHLLASDISTLGSWTSRPRLGLISYRPLVRPSSGLWAWTELPQWLSWFSSLQTAASETPIGTVSLETPANAIPLHLIGFFRQELPGSEEPLSLLLEELAFE